MLSPLEFLAGHQTPPWHGWAGFLAPKYVAALLILISSMTFHEFRSTTFIGDGLRYLPALRTITEGSPATFQPKPWLEVYRAYYERAVVHHHFLFGLTMRTAFALQRAVGIYGDSTIAIQAVNAISAAIAGGLFFLLVLRLGVPKWISLVVAVGVCLSPAYLLAATNVAEVALALPFFVGTLLVLANRDSLDRGAIVTAILAALAAITYLLAEALVPCIAVAAIISRSPSGLIIRKVVLFVSVFTLIFLGIWVGVLYLSGVHSPSNLAIAILKFPEQGTYGQFKLSSLIATPVGLTHAFFPILPDDFRGLRSLYHTPLLALIVGILSTTICALLAGAIYLLFQRGIIRNVALLSAVLTFLLVEAVCMWWDPYHLKLQIFALILFWLTVAVAFAGNQSRRAHRWFLLLFVTAVAAGGLKILRTNIRPSQTNENARRLHAIVGEGVLVTGWSSDVAHLWLYSNGDNIIPLPDFSLTRNLQPSRVEADLNELINKATADGRNVYFYGLLEDDDADLTNIYEIKFRLTGFTSYLRGLQKTMRPVGRFEQPGGHWNILYVYSP